MFTVKMFNYSCNFLLVLDELDSDTELPMITWNFILVLQIQTVGCTIMTFNGKPYNSFMSNNLYRLIFDGPDLDTQYVLNLHLTLSKNEPSLYKLV